MESSASSPSPVAKHYRSGIEIEVAEQSGFWLHGTFPKPISVNLRKLRALFSHAVR